MKITPDLQALRSTLQEMHRYLLAIAKKSAEEKLGKVLAPGDWFQHLISDPQYAWLKPLTTLVADLDALSEHKNIVDRDLSILRHAIDDLFFNDNDELQSFNHHYRQVFINNHELMVSHGRLKEATATLPEPLADVSGVSEIRKGWHDLGLSQTKRKTRH